MPKLTGPMISAAAAGQMSKTLVFSTWRGRSTVKQLIKPKQPRTQPQVGVRAILKWLAETWPSIAAADQASWQGLAASNNISPQNAFCKTNAAAMRNDLAPSEVYPAPRDDTAGNLTAPVLTGGPQYVRFPIYMHLAQQNWGYLIWHVTLADYALTFYNLVQIITARDVAWYDWIHRRLPSGTHRYRIQTFSRHGVFHPGGAWWRAYTVP